jgi:NAD+ synthase
LGKILSRYKEIADFLVKFLENEVKKTGLKKAVLGLSGGVDSAVVAVLAQKAFASDLLCVKLPSHYSSQSSLDDADELCTKFNLRNITVSISDMLKVYEEQNPDMDNLRRGNLSARLRMATLFDISAKEGALVLGTSNKSELMLGYGTLYGDLASAINPLGDLYKSEVFELAKYLGVVESIISKPPSADLWSGQSDEADLGYSYAELDFALKLYVEDRLEYDEIISRGVQKQLLDMIISRIYRNQFKRKMPVIAKLTSRTINHDFNYPRDITL